MRALPDDALDAIESQVVRATVKEAVNPAHLAPGELSPIERRDGLATGGSIGRSGKLCEGDGARRKACPSFTTDRGRYNVAKGSWF